MYLDVPDKGLVACERSFVRSFVCFLFLLFCLLLVVGLYSVSYVRLCFFLLLVCQAAKDDHDSLLPYCCTRYDHSMLSTAAAAARTTAVPGIMAQQQ